MDSRGEQDGSESAPSSLGSGRYEIREFLGSGTQKRVYRAYDLSLGREVAVALVHADGLDEAGLPRLAREARASGRLGVHPNIVATHDVGLEGGRPYIVAEYMSGGDLADRLDRAEGNRLPWRDAIRVAEHVCTGLGHAHRCKVVHRDLKPANIWFAADGTPKVGDFGLAFAADLSRLTKDGVLIGTLAYLSPEQAVGQTACPASDLYALGVILYEMVTGRLPFAGETATSLISQHVHATPLPPSAHVPEIPEALDELVRALLRKVPEDRPDSAAVVVEQLRAIATLTSTDPRGPPSRPLAPTGFVGRRDEIECLSRAFDEVLSGRARVRALVGEAGIGKSRTAEEVTSYARMRGALALIGRCYEGPGAPVYWPWVQLVRTYATMRTPSELAAQLGTSAGVVAQVVPDLYEVLPALEPPPPLDPDQARFRFFDAVARFLERAARERPLLLVVEDIQWADVPSLLLLEFLARELRAARVGILVTCRDTELEPTHPASETLATLTRESNHERLPIAGLTESEVLDLLVRLGGVEMSPEFVRAIHRKTDGNPFFIAETLRHLTEEGIIHRDRRGWVGRGSIDDVGIPTGIRAVIGRRLARLSEACQEALRVGAAVGRDFPAEVVAEALGHAPSAALEALEEAVARGVLTRPSRRTGAYVFSHALLQETLYEGLGVRDRIALHRRLGETLERLHRDGLGAHVAELAHHFFEAMQDGDATKAELYCRRAAERANAQLAYEEAANHFERAIVALDARDPRADVERCELLLELAHTRWSSGETTTARATFLRAAAAARAARSPTLLARAAIGAGGRYPGLQMGVRDDEIVDLLEEALAGFGSADGPLVAEIKARLAEALLFSEDLERRVGLAREAIAVARRHGDDQELAKVLQHAHLPLWLPDNLAERLAMSAEMESLAASTGMLDVALAAQGWRMAHLMEAGDMIEFRRVLGEYARVADELRQPVYRYVTHLRQTMAVLLEGRFADAAALAGQTVPLGEQAQLQSAFQASGVQHFLVAVGQGNLALLEPAVEAIVQQYPGMPSWRIALALLYAETDQRGKAEETLRPLTGTGFETLPRDMNYNFSLGNLALVCAYLGDGRSAEIVYDRLLPQEGRCLIIAGTAPMGSASLFLALLASTLERLDEAEAHYQRALEMNARIGARFWLARTQQAYGEMLLARGAGPDLGKARDLLALARQTCDELDLTALAKRVTAAQDRLARRPTT